MTAQLLSTGIWVQSIELLSFGDISPKTKRAHDMNRSDQQLTSLREGLVRGRASTVYGITNGGTLADMQPFHGTASRFLQEVRSEAGPYQAGSSLVFDPKVDILVSVCTWL